MRKHLFVLVALAGLAGGTAQAQTERGTTLIGLSAGNLGYGRGADHTFRQYSGTLTPTVGRFVADNLLVGLGVQVGHSHRQSTYSGLYFPSVISPNVLYDNITFSERRWSAGVTPFARYYFLNHGRHHLFGEASLHANRTWARDRYQNEVGPLTSWRQYNSFGYRAAVGYSYSLSPRTMLEVSAGYQRTYAPTGNSGKLDARIGVNFVLPSGKR